MSRLRMSVRALTALASVALVTACGGVGDGNKPEYLDIYPPGSQEAADSMRGFECVAQQLTGIATFSDGDRGSYTSRGVWSSSDESVVRVSNGDIPVPGTDDGSEYSAGVLLPVATGQARVIFEYLGMTADIDVTVTPSGDFRITPSVGRLAPRSSLAFEVKAVLDGVERDITTSARFAFAEANDEVASLDTQSAQVFGISPGGPLDLVATLPLCPEVELHSAVTVAPIQSLVLEHEEGFIGRLQVSTTEALRLYADFGDGPEQDLSPQAAFSSSNEDLADFSSGGLANYLFAMGVGDPVTVEATFPVDDETNITSNSLQIQPVDLSLTAIEIQPLEASMPSLTSLQFSASGIFANGDYVQPLTRHVEWRSSDTDAVTIASGVSQTAGLATSVRDQSDVVTIEATNEDATQVPTQQTTLSVTP